MRCAVDEKEKIKRENKNKQTMVVRVFVKTVVFLRDKNI